jgi:hypothetical protein
VTHLGDGATLREPAALLASWEAGATAPELARGAAVLQALGICADESALDMPLGRVGSLAARCLADGFGDRVGGVLTCPLCHQTLEVEVFLSALMAAAGPSDEAAIAGDGASVDIAVAGRRLSVRSPTTRDLLAAAGRADAREVILGRCVASTGPEHQPGTTLSTEEREQVDVALERLAEPALPVVRATCPDCGSAASGVLDPAAMLWEQVSRAAPTVLRDIATLAAAFGWPESVIVALSPARRAAYLELARA